MVDQPDWILQVLKSSDPGERRSGIFAAARAALLESIPRLKIVAGSDEVVELRFLARKALSVIGAQAFGAETPAPRTEISAADSLASIEAGIASDDPGIRASALRAAALKGDRTLLPRLISRVKEETHFEVRSVLVLTLARLGGVDQIEHIVGMLGDSDARCRANAVEALHSLRVPEAYPHIVRMAQDADNRVRTNALKALGELGKVNIFKVCRAMLGPSQEYWTRDSAAWLLASWKMPDAVGLLEQALSDPYPAVAAKAKKGLEALSTSDLNPTDGLEATAVLDHTDAPHNHLRSRRQVRTFLYMQRGGAWPAR